MIAQALLVTLAAIIGNSEPGIGVPMVQRPIVMGPLVGLLLGDLQTGLAVGTLLELAFLGTQSIGAALPPDLTTGGILATAFAISTGATPEAAVALALPIASLALLAEMLFSKEVAPYFFLGFLLAAYLQVPVLGIALFGVVLVALLLINDNAKASNVQEVSEDEDF